VLSVLHDYLFPCAATDETGLQEERQKVDNRVKENKRRTIQDVVSRVILDGDDAAAADIDADTLLANPAAVAAATGKETLVKKMAVKFSGVGGAPGASGTAGSGNEDISKEVAAAGEETA
jgi:hypothetical protein